MDWTIVTAHYAVKPYILFSRYLAGGLCLRAARTVSRQQFYMQACLAAPADTLVTDLIETVSRYNHTVEYLAGSALSVQDLCYANRVLSQHDSNRPGKIRLTPFIHNIKKNKIALPAPDAIESYMQNALNQLLSYDIKPLQAAVYITSNLLWLHPFSEKGVGAN